MDLLIYFGKLAIMAVSVGWLAGLFCESKATYPLLPELGLRECIVATRPSSEESSFTGLGLLPLDRSSLVQSDLG